MTTWCGLDWFWSNAMGGVKLLVCPEDAMAAEDALSNPSRKTLTCPEWETMRNPYVRNAVPWTSTLESWNQRLI